MRILNFAGYYLPHVGGYIHNIHELSRRLVSRGHEVTVLTCNTDGRPATETVDGVRIIRIPTLAHVAGVLPVPVPHKLFIQDGYDVVVTQSQLFPTSSLGAIYAVRHGLPLIHVERGSCHSIVGGAARALLSPAIHLHDHTVGRTNISCACAAVGVSEAAAGFIRHLYDPAKPVVVHNGVNVSEEYSLPTQSGMVLQIVFVGRLVYAKGVQDLIEAFSAIASANPWASLLIVGDGPYRQTLDDMAQSALCWDRIRFLGEIPPSEVPRVLSECNIFVNPSYSEGLPTSVLEAASAGLATIATDVGGTRDIIEHNRSGIIVQPGDVGALIRHLVELLNNPGRRVELGQAARESARKFNWETITDQWEDLLGRVCQKGGR